MRYEQYGYRYEFNGIPRSHGGFAILPQRFGEGMGVLIKQRNGNGSSPYLFDLPGGGMSSDDYETLTLTASREAFEEVGIRTNPSTAIAVGAALWLPIRRDGEIVRVDCAQAYIMEAGAEVPEPTEEALNIAVVHERSALGFSIVGLKNDSDPTKRVFGRTAIMLYDGLSITKGPFYDGPADVAVTSRLNLPYELVDWMYMPVDDGNYLARMKDGIIQIFYRLNPFESQGRFVGNLEDLAQVT
jgi:8-oxo-dGTP pyrophosphatase MutT (NUDIX family)